MPRNPEGNNWTLQKFLTPSTLPDDRQCRSLSIPDDPAWLGAVNAALLLLADERLWEQVNETDMSPADVAAFFQIAYVDFIHSSVEGGCLDPCQRFAQCILDSTDVQNSLDIYLISKGLLGNGGAVIPSVITQPVVPTGTGCSDAHKYGQALALVAALDRLATDLFEVLGPLTEPLETAANLALYIPVLGPLISAAFDMAALFITYGGEVYTAAYSSPVQEEIACDLLCAFSDCDLSLQAMMEVYLADLGDYEPPGAFATIEETAAWAATLAVSGDKAVVLAVQYMILAGWAAGSVIINAKPTYLYLAAYGATDEDPTGTCDECNTCYGWGDGHGNDSDVVLVEDPWGKIGTYNSTEHRWEAVWNGIHNSGKYVVVDLPVSGDYTYYPNKIKIAYNLHNTRGGLGAMDVGIWDPGGEVWTILFLNNGAYPPNGPGVCELDVSGWGGGINTPGPLRIRFACRSVDDDSGAYAYITGIQICGIRVDN